MSERTARDDRRGLSIAELERLADRAELAAERAWAAARALEERVAAPPRRWWQRRKP